MKIFFILISCLIFTIFTPMSTISSNSELNFDNTFRETLGSLYYLEVNEKKISELVKPIVVASKATGIPSSLICTLIYTESSFRSDVISNKGYVGYMQTPWATVIYPDVDILYGCRILKDKLKYADNNILKAITLYKGGLNKTAKKQAVKTLNLHKEVCDFLDKMDIPHKKIEVKL